jgi:Protein of unknown function (DUF2917)
MAMSATRWTASRNEVSRPVELARDATLRLPRRRGGVVVLVERGTVLVTQAGDPEDHVLAAGGLLHVPEGGLAVAWALSEARLEVCDAPARALGKVPATVPSIAGVRVSW